MPSPGTVIGSFPDGHCCAKRIIEPNEKREIKQKRDLNQGMKKRRTQRRRRTEEDQHETKVRVGRRPRRFVPEGCTRIELTHRAMWNALTIATCSS